MLEGCDTLGCVLINRVCKQWLVNVRFAPKTFVSVLSMSALCHKQT